MRSLFTLLFLLSIVPIQAARWYVNDNATGANTGLTWTDAFNDLQDALGASSFGDEIWVAAGTYKPTSGTSTSATFILVNGVGLYGGFAGTETVLSERDYTLNTSTLSGNIGVGSSTTDNSIHVVFGDNVGSLTRLDGFRITDGHSSSLAGGLYLSASSPTVANCTFINNFALDAAGALTHNGGTLTLSRCVFLSNFTDGIGGALQIRSGTARITDCRFTSNMAGDNGGAMYLSGGVTYIDRCIIDGNSAEVNSGAIYHLTGNSMFMSNSLVVGNYAPRISIMYIPPISNTMPHGIVNCTFAQNRQDQNSGTERPIVCNTLTEVANSIFWDNGGVSAMYPNADAHDCIIQGGFSNGSAIVTADPQFVFPGLNSQAPFTLSGVDYHVAANAPGIDLGVASAIVAPALFDLDSLPRTFGSRPDIGAYELEYCQLPLTITTANALPFCPQSTQVLTADAGDVFIWYQGATAIGTSASVSVTTSGTYIVAASSQEGCRGRDTLLAIFSPIGFQLVGSTSICAGESTVLSLSGQFSDPLWNGILASNELTVFQAGAINVTANTASGCPVSLSTSVAVNALPNPVIILVGTQLRAGTGFSSYQWFLNGVEISGAMQSSFTPVENGVYTAGVTNSSGCEGISAPFTFSVLGMEELLTGLNIYPQPGNGTITVEGVQQDANFRLMDVSGRIVSLRATSGVNSMMLHMEDIPSGAYILMIERADGRRFTQKILHQLL